MTKNFVCKTSSLTRPMLPLIALAEPHFEQKLEAVRLAIAEFQQQRLSIVPDAGNYRQYAQLTTSDNHARKSFDSQNLQSVEQAIASLDRITRQVFELYRNGGMPRDAIAEKLELTCTEVDTHIAQVLQALEKCMLS